MIFVFTWPYVGENKGKEKARVLHGYLLHKEMCGKIKKMGVNGLVNGRVNGG